MSRKRGAKRAVPTNADTGSRKSRRRERSQRRLTKQALVLLVGVALAAGAAVSVVRFEASVEPREVVRAVAPPIVAPAPQAPRRAEPVEATFDAEALEKKLRGIAGDHGGDYGAVVFDPSSGKSPAISENESFGAASIGKLPVLLTLYKEAAQGDVDLDDEISILPSDVQSYGSGVLQNSPVGTRITLRECAFLMINESDNTAWVMLERELGKGEIQNQLDRRGIRDTDYGNRTTTPSDVLRMLKTIADPSFTSEKFSREMLVAMTDTYLEDRIPAGLPPDVRVAHKTGSYYDYASGGSFGDAGIVFSKDGEQARYFIVVLSGGVGDEADARAAMREMSRAAYEAFSENR